MKLWPSLLASILFASVALAEPPDAAPTKDARAAKKLVERRLVQPLARRGHKRSKFSRVAPMPVSRRVRVLDEVAQVDARGKRFVRFAVDERHGYDDDGTWRREKMVGCAYVEESLVFVKRGDEYVPARRMTGGKGRANPRACRPADGAQLARR